MAAKKKASLRFETSYLEKLQKELAKAPSKKGATEGELVRHSFRATCEEEDTAFVEIEGKKYPVVNIGNRGLGIQLPEETVFSQGENLPKIIFNFRDRKATLKGRVVHVSMEDEKVYLCGISLSKMTKEEEKLFLEIIQQKRLVLSGRD